MENKLLTYIKCTADLLASVINNTVPSELSNEINLKALYLYAKKHSVSNILYVALQKLGYSNEELADFYDDYKIMILREARQEMMAETIFALFDENEIDYIPLKGFVLKNMYPKVFYRSSTDVDIFVREEDRKKVEKIMLSLGFNAPLSGPDHDAYLKEPVYNFEIHHTIAESHTKYYQYFKDSFNHTIKSDENLHKFYYKDEDFYIHLIYHLYKHFSEGGCGIRTFLDIWIFRNCHNNLDNSYIENKFKEFDLYHFEQVVLNLTKILFEKQDCNTEYEKLLIFISNSTTHGNSEYGNLSRINFSKNNAFSLKKYKYFLSRWFRSADEMAEDYPYLEKRPYLLPFAWLQKSFKTLFFKPEALKSEFNYLKKADKDSYNFIKEVHRIAGINHKVHKG